MVLGELEKEVLEYFWKTNVADAKTVHAHFCKRRGGSLNTIKSTLDRLYRKGLLTRYKESHAFQYQAAVKRSAFIGKLVQGVLENYAQEHDEGLLAAFASLSAELDETQLERLERMIRDFRERETGGERP
jgi:predicted transcriptional regulator